MFFNISATLTFPFDLGPCGAGIKHLSFGTLYTCNIISKRLCLVKMGTFHEIRNYVIMTSFYVWLTKLSHICDLLMEAFHILYYSIWCIWNSPMVIFAQSCDVILTHFSQGPDMTGHNPEMAFHQLLTWLWFRVIIFIITEVMAKSILFTLWVTLTLAFIRCWPNSIGFRLLTRPNIWPI